MYPSRQAAVLRVTRLFGNSKVEKISACTPQPPPEQHRGAVGGEKGFLPLLLPFSPFFSLIFYFSLHYSYPSVFASGFLV